MKNLPTKGTLILSTILYSNVSMAFNWQRCKKEIFFSGNGAGMLISTSSYFSSTGYCSALSLVEDQKKYYIAHNREPLGIDLARGGGEYVFAYASLSGCSGNAKKEYAKHLQRNFIKIYGEKTNNSADKVFNNIEEVIKNNKKLSEACSSRKII